MMSKRGLALPLKASAAPPSPHASEASNPPWVQALLTGMSALNQKQDSLHARFRQLHQTVDEHAQKLHRLTDAQQNNSTLHEHTLTRLQKVKDVRSRSRSVSPVPLPKSPALSRAPSPRAGRGNVGCEEPADNFSDMVVVLGGWLEARRSEIVAEVETILKELRLGD